MSAIELGKVQVSIGIAAKLATALQIPLSRLWRELERSGGPSDKGSLRTDPRRRSGRGSGKWALIQPQRRVDPRNRLGPFAAVSDAPAVLGFPKPHLLSPVPQALCVPGGNRGIG